MDPPITCGVRLKGFFEKIQPRCQTAKGTLAVSPRRTRVVALTPATPSSSSGACYAARGFGPGTWVTGVQVHPLHLEMPWMHMNPRKPRQAFSRDHESDQRTSIGIDLLCSSGRDEGAAAHVNLSPSW